MRATAADSEIATWTTRFRCSEPPTNARRPSEGRDCPLKPPSSCSSSLALGSLPAVGVAAARAAGAGRGASPEASRPLAAAYTVPSCVSARIDRLPTATAANRDPATRPFPTRRDKRRHGKTQTSAVPSAMTAAHRPCPAPTAIAASPSALSTSSRRAAAGASAAEEVAMVVVAAAAAAAAEAAAAAADQPERPDRPALLVARCNRSPRMRSMRPGTCQSPSRPSSHAS